MFRNTSTTVFFCCHTLLLDENGRIYIGFTFKTNIAPYVTVHFCFMEGYKGFCEAIASNVVHEILLCSIVKLKCKGTRRDCVIRSHTPCIVVCNTHSHTHAHASMNLRYVHACSILSFYAVQLSYLLPFIAPALFEAFDSRTYSL